MGNIFLTWMPDIISDAGANVCTYEGYQTRARSTGGFSNNPLCVMWHHTASQTSPENDAHYMCYGSDSRPIACIMVDRTGKVWVLAAGATNTNGKGKSLSFSRGTVPQDRMNEFAVGMEICNNGVGEQYPKEQVDAAFIASNAINAYLGNKFFDVCTHQFYAPDRKIDPATTDIAGPWQPGAVTSSDTWSCDDLKTECVNRGTAQPPESDIVSGSSSLWLGGGRLDNFVTGNDKRVYHNWYEPKKGWTAWESLEGQLDGSPSVTGQGDNGTPVRIDITGKGTDNPQGLWHKWYDGKKWSGWERVADWP